jgi:hypothetical protein
VNEYIESRIEVLAKQGRIKATAVDRAVAKGLLRADKAAEVKGKIGKGKPDK